MDCKKIYKKIVRINNLYKNSIEIRKLDSNIKEIMNKNKKYKGKYKGKRCFIFGNGPSINTLDFKMFEGEIVFTVNELFRHTDFECLSSEFHFIADPAYFKLKRNNPEDNDVISLINRLGNREKSPVFFLPIEAKKIIHDYGWDRRLRIQYFSSKLEYYDDYEEEFDFTKFIPGFQAVVQWCIAFAVYAGFKEIYLLGCDATNIVTDLSLYQNKNIELTYAYSLSEEATNNVKKKHLSNSLEYSLFGYHRIVHLFSELYKYCKKRNVVLYNCSSETILDCIPRKDIQTILKRES